MEKVICKKDCSFYNGWGTEPAFKKGVTYEIEKTYIRRKFFKKQEYVVVLNPTALFSSGKKLTFTKKHFNEYFENLREIRKLKLKKINE